MNVTRYIALTKLIPPLLALVDENKMAFTTAADHIACLSQQEQTDLLAVIRIYPVIGLSLSAGDMSHTDTAEDVRLTTENLGSNEVVWTVLRDGKEIMPPFALNASGGHGFFSEAGLYTFTASVTDELGRVTTASDSIQIYPVGVSGFYLPKMFHTDSVVTLVTGLPNNG